jgi:hypothetical protein
LVRRLSLGESAAFPDERGFTITPPRDHLSMPHGTSTRPFCECLLMLFALACGDTRGATHDSARAGAQPPGPAHLVTQPYADTVAIAVRTDSIDRYVHAHPERMTMFAKVADSTGLVAVKDTASWPSDTEISYNIVADSAGRPLIHRQTPTSESGDRFAVESHYFAPDGRTILHQYMISGFSSGCASILRETKRLFLGPSGAALAETRRFTDGDGKPITADGCDRRSDDAPAPKRSASDLPFLR